MMREMKIRVFVRLSDNLVICVQRACGLEARGEKLRRLVSEKDRNKILSLRFFNGARSPDNGTRSLDWLIGNSEAESFEELCQLFDETIRKIKSREIKRLPYHEGYLSAKDLEIFQDITKAVYNSFYRVYWSSKKSSFYKKSREIESRLGSAHIIEKLENLTGGSYPHNVFQVYLLDEGGPAFIECDGTRAFIPMLKRIEGTVYIIAHELSHSLLSGLRWRENNMVKDALKGFKVRDRILGAIEECTAHYLGVSVALQYGENMESCGVHRIVEEVLLKKLPEFYHSKPRNIVSLLSEVTRAMIDFQDSKLWTGENYIRPYKVKLTYNLNGFPIDLRRTRARYA